MFFILSKVLSFIIQPMVWMMAALLFSFLTKRTELKKRLLVTSIVVFFFFSNTVIFSEFARLWEVEGVTIESTNHYDIGVVLGGMTEYNNGLKRLSIRRGGDRIWQAIQLYHAGKIDKILISGANGHLIDMGIREATQLKVDLVKMGIPEQDIITESKSRNTYENAVESKIIIDNLGGSPSVLLITSAMHMKRAASCFNTAGFNRIELFSTDHFTGEDRGYQIDQYIIPNVFTFAMWNQLIKEWVGYITYDIVGYI